MSVQNTFTFHKLSVLSILLFCLFVLSLSSFAQDSSLKIIARQKIDSALLTDTASLTKGDYLSELQKLLEAQNKVPNIISGFDNIGDIEDELNDDDSLLLLIKQTIGSTNNRSVSLQNLQTYNHILDQLQDKVQNDYQDDLTSYSSQLDDLKRELFAFRKDSIILKIYKDAEMRREFLPQLIEIRNKWKSTDSIISETSSLIKQLKTRASNNAFITTNLLSQLDDLIASTAINAFGKERRYLWEPINKKLIEKYSSSIEKKLATEKRIADYYFDNTTNNRLLPLVFAIIFFFWVSYNFWSIKKLKRLDVINKFNFEYISAYPLWGSMIFISSLTPLYDLSAPAIYTEIAGILTLVILTFYFIKRLPLSTLLLWCVFALLFLSHPIIRFMGLPIYEERNFMFVVNIASVLFGVISIWILRKKVSQHKAIFWVGIFYTLLNLAAVFCNLFGRVTLSQMAYAASVYGFSQAVSLTILSHLLREAVLLQIQAIRLRKKYPEDFEYVPVANGVFKLTAVFASAVWLVVFADNINVLDKLQDWVSGALNQVHTVGSFTYSIGGILLFIFIIWIANFFQKYISYFFGDLGEDMEVENKEGRSRLLMTRLIVLIAGFLLAVAASGLPIDKITIILGALSVGIGLGLQNIVNNFVSGIILIFDRTLHIGDVVQISDQKGRVKEIGIRTSKLVTDDGAEIVIPNGDVVSHNIINWTLTNSNVRLNLTFTIEKPFNLEDVEVICREVLFDNKNVLTQKEPQVLRTTITPASEVVKVYFWCNSITATEATYSTVYPAIYSRFQAKGMKLL